jgi:hypothetical protein
VCCRDVVASPAGFRHLEFAYDRPDRLRGETRVLKLDTHLDGLSWVVGAKEPGVGIALSERINPVEDVFGAPIPELAMVKDRVDHRRGVARLHPSRLHGADLKAQRIRAVAEKVNTLR